MSTDSHKEEKSELKIPFGGIIFTVISGICLYMSAKTKKRAISMEESKSYTHGTIENAKDGDYCSLTGSVQPIKPGDYIRTRYGQRDTVLYLTNTIERVKVTTTSSTTVNQKTRNPRVEYSTSNRIEENNLTQPTVFSVRFGLFDAVTKKNVELRCAASRFEGSLQSYRHQLPQSQGVNININNSSVPTVGEVRTVESLWEVEKYLQIEKLGENDIPRSYSTVFGVVKSENGSHYLTDEGATFNQPFIFAFGSRGSVIEGEKATSRALSYAGILFLLIAGAAGYFEMFGTPAALKEDTAW